MCFGFVYVCEGKSTDSMEYGDCKSNGTKSTVAYTFRITSIFSKQKLIIYFR